MDYRDTLESLAAERNLQLVSLRDVIRDTSCSRKITCCGGWVLRVYSESSTDTSVVLRDASDTSLICALHSEVVKRYPDVLTKGALLLFQSPSFIASPSLTMKPFLVAGLANLTALMLPDDSDPRGRKSPEKVVEGAESYLESPSLAPPGSAPFSGGAYEWHSASWRGGEERDHTVPDGNEDLDGVDCLEMAD